MQVRASLLTLRLVLFQREWLLCHGSKDPQKEELSQVDRAETRS